MRTLNSTSLMLAVLATLAFTAGKAAAEDKELQEAVRTGGAVDPDDFPLAPVADAVLKNSYMQKKKISAKFAKDFGMPSQLDELWIYQIAMKEEDGKTKWIFVRPRDSGRIDMFFLVTTPELGTYYYHTTAAGRLIRSTFVTKTTISVVPNEDAQKGFQAEFDYWQHWMKDAKAAADSPPKR